jgi:hypothetical protein
MSGRTNHRTETQAWRSPRRLSRPIPLSEAARPALLELADGDDLHLRIGAVAKRLGDTTEGLL